MRHLAPTAGEAGDLALCTGRLAYADAAWTLSSGPGHQPRPPQDLAPHPGDVPLALAAAHHACDAVTSQAYAQRERIRTAASAGRSWSPPGPCPTPWTYPAPSPPLSPIMSTPCSAYARTPLKLPPKHPPGRRGGRSRPGPQPRADRRQGRGPRRPRCQHEPRRPTAPEPAVTGHSREDPGAVKAALHRLGVKSPDLLQRAADIDRASEQLIIEAAGRRTSQHPATSTNRQKQNTDHQRLVSWRSGSGVPHKNPTSPRPGPPPQVSHGHDGIPRHTPALMLK